MNTFAKDTTDEPRASAAHYSTISQAHRYAQMLGVPVGYLMYGSRPFDIKSFDDPETAND